MKEVEWRIEPSIDQESEGFRTARKVFGLIITGDVKVPLDASELLGDATKFLSVGYAEAKGLQDFMGRQVAILANLVLMPDGTLKFLLLVAGLRFLDLIIDSNSGRVLMAKGRDAQ